MKRSKRWRRYLERMIHAGRHRLPLLASFLAFLTVFFNTTGCNYTQKYEKRSTAYGIRKIMPQGKPENFKLYGQTLENKASHENQTLEYSNKLSSLVAGIPGVLTSIVMVADQNAYVAIVLDGSGTGTMGRGDRGKLEGNMRGTTRGMYDVDTGSQYADPNTLVTKSNSHFTTRNHENLSSKFKHHIAFKIHGDQPEIQGVHISANREFINQMNVFASEAELGVDLNKYLTDFNALVQQQFAGR